MDWDMKYHVAAMFGVDTFGEVPADLIDRLEEVDAVIKRAKPDGGLKSTQVAAAVILQWRREMGG